MSIKKRHILQAVVTLAVIGVGALGLAALTASRPELKRKKTVKVLPVALYQKAEPTKLKLTISGEGTVAAARESSLSAEVAGRVVFMAPSLVEGGSFKKGQVLLKIEKVDYQLALTQRQAQVREAQTNLRKTQEDAATALEEWAQVGEGKNSPPPLVARKPQLMEAKAKLEAARAQLAQARHNLARTEVKAPYDGRVTTKNVDLGQYVKTGDRVAQIFSTDAAEIVVPLEDRDLRWLEVPGLTQQSGPGSTAVVSAAFAGRELTWQGRVVRALGKVDETTRLVRVVVRVENPYAKLPPLAVGLFVKVQILGKPLDNVFILPRMALRQGDVVWVVDDQDKLSVRKVRVAHANGEKVYIASGLKDGERVVTSPLKAVNAGMLVKPVPARQEG